MRIYLQPAIEYVGICIDLPAPALEPIADPVFERLARNFHPSPGRLSGYVLKLMARNGCQIFGDDFRNPSNLAICYTEGSRAEPIMRCGLRILSSGH